MKINTLLTRKITTRQRIIIKPKTMCLRKGQLAGDLYLLLIGSAITQITKASWSAVRNITRLKIYHISWHSEEKQMP
jgi:hypothetical protein